jgi:hypothetical protein
MDKMTRLLCVTGILLSATGPGFSQTDGARTEREEWLAEVDRARQRVDKIRKEGSFVDDERETVAEAIKERTRRALADEDLRPGDLVSTEGGFVRFEGISPDSKRIFTPVDPQPRHQK